MAITRIGTDARSFQIIQTDAGTNPTAQQPNETLTLTSTDGSIQITGDLGTDTVDFSVTNQSSQSASNTNVYGSVAAVGMGSTTNVTSYTVPGGQTFTLHMVEFNGENIARYQVLINDTVVATKHTYFGGAFFGEFWFDDLLLNAGDEIKLQVLHSRTESADFFGRVLGNLS